VTSSYVAWETTTYGLQVLPEEADKVKWQEGWFERDATGRRVWRKRKLVWADDGGEINYRRWWKNRFLSTAKDYVPAGDAIRRAADSSWWNWDQGSRLFHWRWPEFYQEVIRDGLRVHFQDAPPAYRKSQRDISDEVVKAQVIAKLLKVRERGYISPGMVESLTAFFERSQKGSTTFD
jgi:hypothetical protein